VLGPGDFLVRDYYTPDEAGAHRLVHRLLSQPARGRHHPLPQELSARVRLGPRGKQPRHHAVIAGTCPFPANRYVIEKAGARQLVLYWYWAHDRGVASEYWAKFYLVKDSIRMNRSDGALVRIRHSPVLPGETLDAAQQRLLPFASQCGPAPR
jgi:hypothetical protein